MPNSPSPIPAPFYRCFAAQLLVCATILMLWPFWYADEIDVGLAEDFPKGSGWWIFLELIVRIALLPLCASFLALYSSFVLDSQDGSFIAPLFVGPVLCIASYLVFDTTEYQHWLLGGAAFLIGVHFLFNGRIYLATLSFWLNSSKALERTV